MSQTRRRLVISAAVGALLIAGSGVAANADDAADTNSTNADAVVSAISDSAPSILETAAADSTSTSTDAMIATAPGATVTAPETGDQPVVLSPNDATSVPLNESVHDIATDDPQASLAAAAATQPAPTVTPVNSSAIAPSETQRTIRVSLPGAESIQGMQTQPGLTVYPDTDPGASQAVQAAQDGTTHFLTVISDPDAPSAYTYHLSLAANTTLALDADGGATIAADAGNGQDAPIAHIDKPWGVDANQSPVPTYFTVAGDDLTLHVDHTTAALPVTADPELFYFHYFSPASPYAQGGSMYGDSVGVYDQQVNYANMQHLSLQWGFKLSYAQRSACAYHAAREDAYSFINGVMTTYHDGHIEDCGYQFHSSFDSYRLVNGGAGNLRGYIGMNVHIQVQIEFQTGPRSIRVIFVTSNAII